MTALEITFAVISALGVGCSVLFGILAFSRNKKQDDTNVGKSSGTILAEIGYIKGGIDDIKTEQREQRKTNIEIMTRLVTVEESTKQAHKRINEHIEHGGHHYEHGA